jgi:hypothetical protein
MLRGVARRAATLPCLPPEYKVLSILPPQFFVPFSPAHLRILKLFANSNSTPIIRPKNMPGLRVGAPEVAKCLDIVRALNKMQEFSRN